MNPNHHFECANGMLWLFHSIISFPVKERTFCNKHCYCSVIQVTFFSAKWLREWEIHVCANVNAILKDPYWYWLYHSLNLVSKYLEVVALSAERTLLSFRSVFRTALIPDLKSYSEIIGSSIYLSCLISINCSPFTDLLFLQAFAVCIFEPLLLFSAFVAIEIFLQVFWT